MIWIFLCTTSPLRLDGSLGFLLAKPLTCPFQMRLLLEEVPLPSSPEASAVCGHQRVVPSSPLVCRQMAEKLAARRKSIPYRGVAK